MALKNSYRTRQSGHLTLGMILLLAGLIVIFKAPGLKSLGGVSPSFDIVVVIIAVGLILTCASFYSLTIQLDYDQLSFWFGIGLIRKSIRWDEILSVSLVKIPWFYLWGIKSIPGGWYYSVAPEKMGLELSLIGGRRILLGTSRPEELLARVEMEITL
jgi:hypothetical protein